jgi:hypothetical protein
MRLSPVCHCCHVRRTHPTIKKCTFGVAYNALCQFAANVTLFQRRRIVKVQQALNVQTSINI